jgi:hypothetical protein
MSKKAIEDFIKETEHTFYVLAKEIELFDDEQWTKGLDSFLTPVNVSMHIFDCLDFYFTEKPGEEYPWGHYFGGGWWELPAERLPGKKAMLEYAQALQRRILGRLNAMNDEDLLKSLSPEPDSQTFTGHFLYAMKHTLHHHGELAALAVFHGKEGGSWD